MRFTILALLAWSAALASTSAEELTQLCKIGQPAVVQQPVAEADRAVWQGHIEHLYWAGDDILVTATLGGLVRCHTTADGRELWSKPLGGEIRPMTGDAIHSVTGPHSADGNLWSLGADHVIRELSLSDGRELRRFTREQLASLLKKDFVLPGHMAWLRDTKRVFIATYGDGYGLHGFVLDIAPFRPAGEAATDGFLRSAEVHASGRYLTTIGNGRIRIWSFDEHKQVYEFASGDALDTIDAPFMSNAQFNGKQTLVYTIDNSWATGQAFVQSINQTKADATFNSRHGHVVMDCDFAHGRIALTGTERHVTVVDLQGNVLLEKRRATADRNAAIRFSPSGRRLAVGSWDNTARVFKLPVTPAQRPIGPVVDAPP